MKLIVHLDAEKSIELKTRKFSAIVGRNPQSDLVIPHESISRQHCKIEYKSGVLYITDIGSTNGTFVNGKKIATEERVRLDDNQQIKIGRLECEVSKGIAQEAEMAAPDSAASARGQHTKTTVYSRHELSAELATAKSKRPRNPVTDEIQNQEIEVVESKRTYIILLMLVVSLLLYLMAPIYL
jgi:predicted component of type VI protein secretion system